MTHEHTQPHYKDHETRGGLKLRPMFSIDAMGRNTLELVCPELRELDADTAEGFLEITKDRVKETLRDMRSASPDGRVDCYLIAPKPGYKLDRITLKGDNAVLLTIAQQYGELHMGKDRQPEYKPTMAFQTIANTELLREISGRGPDNRVVIAIKVKPILAGQSLAQVEEAINAAGKANGVIVDATRPYDTEKRVLYLDGPLQHVADIATQFGSKAGRNIHALLEADRSPA